MSHSPTDRVRAAYRRIAETDRPEVWITLCDEHDLLVAAKEIEDRLDGGEQLPLAGLLVAVKDNIDVAGLPTTAACPS
ncbi:MAG: allophanate hydrolase, partial [Pseudonocardiales bacterium]|nr:allophanate hydrolase [Pseudonocardiales bacterium]